MSTVLSFGVSMYSCCRSNAVRGLAIRSYATQNCADSCASAQARARLLHHETSLSSGSSAAGRVRRERQQRFHHVATVFSRRIFLISSVSSRSARQMS